MVPFDWKESGRIDSKAAEVIERARALSSPSAPRATVTALTQWLSAIPTPKAFGRFEAAPLPDTHYRVLFQCGTPSAASAASAVLTDHRRARAHTRTCTHALTLIGRV
jgi:hypothetical protein